MTLGDSLILRSTKTGSAAKLILDGSSGTQDVSNVDVADNDATGGSQLLPSSSTNSLNNTNWDFGAETVTWTNGSGDNNWSTAGNWNTGNIPGTDDTALFDSTSTANSTFDTGFLTTIAGLRTENDYTGTITLAQPLGISGSMIISGGILDVSSSNYDVTVDGDWKQYSSGEFAARAGTVYLTSTGDTLTLSGSSSFSNISIDDGLVGYWKFDDGVGTLAKDSSRFGNDGTLTNMTSDDWVDISAGTGTTNFYNPYALDFDGSDDYVETPVNSIFDTGGTAPVTHSAWIKTTTTPSSKFAVIAIANSGYQGVESYDKCIEIDSSNKAAFYVYDGAQKRATSTTSVNDGAWHLLTGIFKSGTIYIYVDGVLENSTAASLHGGISNPTAVFGFVDPDLYGYTYENYSGLIDDVRIYNRALSASEVESLANGNPSTGSGYYTLGASLDISNNFNNYTGNLVSSGSITIQGNWNNQGDFTHDGGGTVNFNGSNQFLSGSTVFWDLTSTGSSADTLTFDYTSRQSISGALTLAGAASNLLSLRSTKTGSASNILLDASAGTQTFTYLDVQDSDASGGAALVVNDGTHTDSGNNTNWSFPVQKTWTNGDSDNDCNNANNWSPSGVPATTDEIILDDTSADDLTWSSSCPASVISWTQTADYTGTVTIQTTFAGGGFDVFGVTNNMTVSGGIITHSDNSTTETYRLRVDVDGDFELGTGATMSGNWLGFNIRNGPGTPPANYYGGAHGGQGGNTHASYSKTYGSITYPESLGSSGNRGASIGGGGAINLTVTGATTLNGIITTNGFGSDNPGAAFDNSGNAGGSIYVKTATITGSGTIQANGGNSSAYASAGGGGRVAIILSSGTDFSDITMTAYGGGSSSHAAAGTVYKEKSTDTANQGELVIDNNDRTTVYSQEVTSLSDLASVSYTFARVTLQNGGKLSIGSDDTLNIANATITGDSVDHEDGIVLSGGTLTTANAFSFSNYFVNINKVSTFDPSTSITVESGARLIANVPHTLSGAVTVQDSGRITHEDNSTAETYKLNLTVRSLTIDENGAINVNNLGYNRNNGPGTPSTNYYGGSHGGYAGGTSTIAETYGSITAPTNLGSGGNRGASAGGGGAVRLVVTDALVVRGTISAKGFGSDDDGATFDNAGNAGGSVYITTGTISGTGTISADGGRSSAYASAGGGGRVAVILTNAGADFSTYTGNMTAYGGLGSNHAAGGTVYKQTYAQQPSSGSLVIANADGASVGATTYTALNAQTSTGVTVGSIIVQNSGKFTIGNDDSLTLTGTGSDLVVRSGTTLTNNGSLTITGTGAHVDGTFTLGSTGSVIYTGLPNDSDVSIYDTDYFNLGINNVNSEFKIQNSELNVNGDLTLTGGNLVTTNGQTVTVSGSWISTGGGFNSGTGRVVLTTSAGTKTFTSSGAFNNLNIAGASDVNFHLGSALDVNGDLTLTGGTLTVTNGQAINVAGSWSESLNGAFTAGTGTVTLDGTVDSADVKTLSGSSSFNNVTLDNGLVGYWKFDEGAGTNARDSSSNSNDGTLTNMDGEDWVDISAGTGTTNFYNPYALDFDGTDDYVGIVDDSTLDLSTFTISYWIKPYSSQDTWAGVLGKGAGSQSKDHNYTCVFNGTSDTQMYCGVGDGTTLEGYDDLFFNVVSDTWNHIVFTAGNGSLIVYVDGTQSNTDSYTIAPINASEPFTIGSETNDNYIYHYTGLIDDVRIYNRALSASEVESLANGNPSTGSGYYTLGSSLDLSGNLLNYTGNLRSSGSITIQGNWNNQGDFSHDGGGTVNLNGPAGAGQLMSGSTVFWNLTSTGSSADTLTFDYTARQSVSGAVTLQGSASQQLSLRSTKSGSGWKILQDALPGTQTLTDLDVQDSDAGDGIVMACTSGCIDSGNNENWTFGGTGTGTLLGTVWVDLDYDGVKDAGETNGFNAVTVTLNGTTTTGGLINYTDTTDASGEYSFTWIAVSDTAGYTLSLDTTEIPAGYRNMSFTSTGGNVLGTGGTVTANFGYGWYGTMSGVVLIDGDGDGVQDAGDTSAFPGATVTLAGTTATGADLSLSTTTTSTGAFNFYEVPVSSGNYSVNVTPTAPHKVTLSQQNSNAMGTGSHMPSALFLIKHVTGTGTISGTVWNDVNGDGVKDAAETSGFSGVTLELTGTTTTGAALSLETQTNLAGTFSFTGAAVSLASGYTTSVNVGAGLLSSGYLNTNFTSSGGNIVGTGSSITIEFGYVQASTISGSVFIDTDEDGIKDPLEAIVAGATVTLTGTSATGGTISLRTLSTGGEYTFSNLPPSQGAYTVVCSIPASFEVITTASRSVAITSGGTNDNQDFRFRAISMDSGTTEEASTITSEGGGVRGGSEGASMRLAAAMLSPKPSAPTLQTQVSPPADGSPGADDGVSPTVEPDTFVIYKPKHEAIIELDEKRQERREEQLETREVRIVKVEEKLKEIPTQIVERIVPTIIPPKEYREIFKPIVKKGIDTLRTISKRTVESIKGAGENIAGTTYLALDNIGESLQKNQLLRERERIKRAVAWRNTYKGTGDKFIKAGRSTVVAALSVRDALIGAGANIAGNIEVAFGDTGRSVKRFAHVIRNAISTPLENSRIGATNTIAFIPKSLTRVKERGTQLAQAAIDRTGIARTSVGRSLSIAGKGIGTVMVALKHDMQKKTDETVQAIIALQFESTQALKSFRQQRRTDVERSLITVRDTVSSTTQIAARTVSTVAVAIVDGVGLIVRSTAEAVFIARHQTGLIAREAGMFGKNAAAGTVGGLAHAVGTVFNSTKDASALVALKTGKGVGNVARIAVIAGDAVSDGVQTGAESVGYYVGRTTMNTKLIAQRVKYAFKDESVPLPPVEEIQTTIYEKDGSILVASLHLNVYTTMGYPYRRTPVVLFSDPKVAMTNDEGRAVFHNVETGQHTLEIHVNGKLPEKRTFVLEPPAELHGAAIDILDVKLPTVRVLVDDPLYDANEGRGVPWYVWIILLMLTAANVEWGWMMWRRRKRLNRR
ncbi:MAG: LamG-like jellyroll fold domain-containing protein [Patescibacteria group bacterium]